MLEFIVMGQIPGTQLQITFIWIQYFMATALVMGLMYADLKLIKLRLHQNRSSQD